MQWSTEVLSALSSDTEPAVLVVFNDRKYMFNTGEHTMRSFLQSGRLLRRTKCLFFTQSRIEQMGGLPGLIMSFADATISNLQLIGPPGLNHLLASMRSYTYRDSIALKTSETPWTTTTEPKPCFTDHNVNVYSIPVIPSHNASVPLSAAESRDGVTMQCDDIATEATTKRKRDLSADAPRKRLHAGDEASTSPEVTGIPEDEADTHRRNMIQRMFPATNIPSPEEVARSERAPIADQPIVSNVDVESMGTTKPANFWKQLPKFINPFPTDLPTMCYLIVGPRYRGKFDAERAKALGIPKGGIRASLAKGEAITFKVEVNGEKVSRTIQPEEVIGKEDPPSAVLILDVPTPAHIPSLLSAFQNSDFYRDIWSEDPSSLAANGEPKFVIRTIYQTCGEGVLDDELYKTFLRGFGPKTHHIIASREFCPDPITFTSVGETQLRMSSIDDKIFPLPKFSLTPKRDLSSVSGLPEKIQTMSPTLLNVMRPWADPVPDPAIVAADKFHPHVNGTETLKFSPALQMYMAQAHAAIKEVITRGEIEPVEGADVGIITLGTGGSMPSKYRNVLSTLVKIPNWGNILLDAGEGTWGQLVRAHGLDGPDNVWKTLRDLKCIFISHIHADHHIGLTQILAKRRELDPPPSEPLYIVSVRHVHLYLREVQDVQDIGIDDPSGNGIIPILSESVHFNETGEYPSGYWGIDGDEPWLQYNKSRESARRMCDALGLEYFKTADVYHRCKCYGASFRHKDGWSITFSGDTAPSANLRKIGMNSTLLIHEATMSDAELSLARGKTHSTVSQAVEEGIAMNAKNILLTHFSARYAKVPPDLIGRRRLQQVTADSFNRERQIIPAFDNLNLTIGDMWKIQFYLRSMVQAAHHVESYTGSPSPEPERLPQGQTSPSRRSTSPSPWMGVRKRHA